MTDWSPAKIARGLRRVAEDIQLNQRADESSAIANLLNMAAALIAQQIIDVRVDLNENIITMDGIEIAVRPREAEIMSVLADANGCVEWDDLTRRVLGVTPAERMDPKRLISCHIVHLRKAIERTRYRIENRPERGFELCRVR